MNLFVKAIFSSLLGVSAYSISYDTHDEALAVLDEMANEEFNEFCDEGAWNPPRRELVRSKDGRNYFYGFDQGAFTGKIVEKKVSNSKKSFTPVSTGVDCSD